MSLDLILEYLSDSDTPTIYNVTITNADTEYSQGLPDNTKRFLMHTKDESAFRLAFVTGRVDDGTAVVFNVLSNQSYNEQNLLMSNGTLYFAADIGTKTMQIIAWT